ncbi:ThiF family adenylyltransferase [Thiomicrospira sp. WB1]|uniref:tRNA threonylcarbamoyladenosine dehydratase n=1 Tax=Thiomicrospira sp. WB1 TaxID=1685380 RepID=UPI00074A0EB7|nr:tRNA threonylcarbamoyladenosine dehydratase [Thiomicrospira sp. WB1]KUJ71107.1 tRNA threonylcarbamoyladenosine dehydratase [Thiomicrospira sp. WB1]
MDSLVSGLFERSALVFSELALARLRSAHVLIAGVGGVGGFAAEAIARAGVGRITLVDHDRVSPSNLNRQIVALSNTLGQQKTEVMAERIRFINPACEVMTQSRFLEADQMDAFLTDEKYDFVIDAIDSLNCKVALIESAIRLSVPIASSMGAGRRTNPGAIHLSDLFKTHSCGLARQIRQRLRKRGIRQGVPVVFSSETPRPPGPMETIDGARGRVVNGTASYMPGIFGLMLAGFVIETLAEDQ